MNELVPGLELPGGVYTNLYLGIAVALLLLSLFVWLRLSRKKKNNPSQHHVGIMSEGVLQPTAAGSSDGGHAHPDASPDNDGQGTTIASHKRQYRDEPTITKHIQIAELAGDQEALAGLYLERARLDISNGDTDAAGDQLRKSIMLATSHNLKNIHASARLELAEISEAEGDMTTACEHWQMARGLFHDLDAQDDIKKTDTRMLSNGCPTDWVLTDF